jgi:hypothetical protein
MLLTHHVYRWEQIGYSRHDRRWTGNQSYGAKVTSRQLSFSETFLESLIGRFVCRMSGGTSAQPLRSGFPQSAGSRGEGPRHQPWATHKSSWHGMRMASQPLDRAQPQPQRARCGVAPGSSVLGVKGPHVFAATTFCTVCFITTFLLCRTFLCVPLFAHI